MAQYQINHICGHETTEQIYGTGVHGERTRQADKLAGRPCEDCRRAKALEAAKGRAAEMPALTGSEKQIAWALTIRDKQLKDLSAKTDQLNENVAKFAPQYPAQAETLSVLIREFVEAETPQTEAKHWIDSRSRDLAVALYERYYLAVEAIQNEINAAKKAEGEIKTAKPIPVPAPEAAPVAEMDDATAERLAGETWARVQDWYDASEVEQTRRELAAGDTGALRGMIADILATQAVSYGPVGVDRVLQTLLTREALSQ